MRVITKLAIMLLAAGESRRMGQPKQLLRVSGTTLLEKAIQTAASAQLGPILVVTGANFSQIEPIVETLGHTYIRNEDWNEGMASSIRKGLQKLLENDPLLDGLFCLVCDQPYLSETLLFQLRETQRQAQSLAAASVYGGKPGTPVLFHKDLFPELLQLKGDEGARKIFKRYKEQLALVPFENGLIDMDTPADYEKFLKRASC